MTDKKKATRRSINAEIAGIRAREALREDLGLPSVKLWRAFRSHRESCVGCQTVPIVRAPHGLCFTGGVLWRAYVSAATAEADEASRL